MHTAAALITVLIVVTGPWAVMRFILYRATRDTTPAPAEPVKFTWRDKIAAAVCDALRPQFDEVHDRIIVTESRVIQHIDTEIEAVHVHLQAATETLADPGPEPDNGALSVDDRAGLHALRGQLGAKHNPPPDVYPRAVITGRPVYWQLGNPHAAPGCE